MRRGIVVAGVAGALVGLTPGLAHAGTTVAYNDSATKSMIVVEAGVRYTLPAGRSSRGWLGLSDVDTIVFGACGSYSIDYKPWQVARTSSIGISSTASVVHAKPITC